MEKFLNFIFPSECLSCHKVGSPFCYACCENCLLISDDVCLVCQENSLNGYTHKTCFAKVKTPSRFVSVFSYQDSVRNCIRNSKYGSKEFAGLKTLTKHALTILSKRDVRFDADLIIPVPISKAKNFERGFNQSAIISNILSTTLLKIPVYNNAVVRIKNTIPQAGLSKEERKTNVQNAFVCRALVKGKKILVVDDICTTGATLISLTNVLLEAGAKDVCCFTLAKRL